MRSHLFWSNLKREKTQDVKSPGGKYPVRALLFLTQPTAFLVATIFLLVYWRVPTHVQIELVVNQETFPVGTIDVTALLHSLNDHAILVQEGKISYPKYPEIQAVAFTVPDWIELEELEKFRIEEMTINTERKEIRFRLDGIAQYIRVSSAGSWHDYRLTQFDRLKNSRWAVILGITGWVIATIVGWYRLYEELKR